MKRFGLMSAVAALAITVCATAAQAAPLTLDFTAGIYSGANNKLTFETVDHDVTVNLYSAGGWLTYDAVDGIGVNGFGIFDDNGEVGAGEIVLSGFSPSQHLYGVKFGQLFTNEGGFHKETGYYRINGAGSWNPFTAINSDGSYELPLDLSDVNSIAFAGNCFGFLCAFNDDFSIKSITVEGPDSITQTPEPASMILLGSGLLGAFAQRRRKKNQAV